MRRICLVTLIPTTSESASAATCPPIVAAQMPSCGRTPPALTSPSQSPPPPPPRLQPHRGKTPRAIPIPQNDTRTHTCPPMMRCLKRHAVYGLRCCPTTSAAVLAGCLHSSVFVAARQTSRPLGIGHHTCGSSRPVADAKSAPRSMLAAVTPSVIRRVCTRDDTRGHVRTRVHIDTHNTRH